MERPEMKTLKSKKSPEEQGGKTVLKKNCRVLVVDDTAVGRSIVTNMLTELGFTNIVQANDGAEAWELVEKAAPTANPIQFILSDLYMPKMDGASLLYNLRQSDYRDIPFVFITAESEAAKVRDTASIGASGYLVKPIESDEMLKVMETAWKKHA